MVQINIIHNGNCLDVLKTFEDNCIDSCVTDPPYGISFMNKHWDYELPSVDIFKEILRVLKPGAHLLCACGTRTQHRMAVNIEDAGFEIRDVISWVYGSGFPKSLDISKAIDKQAGAERTNVIGKSQYEGRRPTKFGGKDNGDVCYGDYKAQPEMPLYEPATEEAKQWDGWGTALKPATEFWTLARKPLQENTVAENVLKFGTGGINIDGSRIETDNNLNGGRYSDNKIGNDGNSYGSGINLRSKEDYEQPQGRFPANVIFDEFTGKILDEQSGISESNTRPATPQNKSGDIYGKYTDYGYERGHEDFGGASRFFYCPKADDFQRNKGLKGFELKVGGGMAGTENQSLLTGSGNVRNNQRHNNHPTVKPIDLMRYLVKLVTPKGGIVLDPFIGSGTTGVGAKMELINYIGIERELEYCKIAEARIAAWNPDKYIPQTLFQ